MSPKSRLSTVGLPNPIVLKYSISFFEVIIDVIDLIFWVTITLNLGILDICVIYNIHLIHWLLVTSYDCGCESVNAWVYVWGDCVWVFGYLGLILGSFMGFGVGFMSVRVSQGILRVFGVSMRVYLGV